MEQSSVVLAACVIVSRYRGTSFSRNLLGRMDPGRKLMLDEAKARLAKCRSLAKEFSTPETLRNICALEAELVRQVRELEEDNGPVKRHGEA